MEWIGVAFIAVPVVVAIGMALLLVVFMLLAFRSPGFGIGAVLSLFMFNALFPSFAGVNLGIRLDALDFITLLLGGVTVLRFVFVAEARHGLLAWYGFVALVLFSLSIGLVKYGTAGGVAARPYFYGIVTCSYILTFRGDITLVRKLVGGMAWLALALLALTVFRWIVTYLPIPALLPSEVDLPRLRRL